MCCGDYVKGLQALSSPSNFPRDANNQEHICSLYQYDEVRTSVSVLNQYLVEPNE
jgi:hypothetical protein